MVGTFFRVILMALVASVWVGFSTIGFAGDPSEMQPYKSVVVTLRKTAEVSSGRIYLGDIVDCKGDAELCRETHGIDIAPSPNVGRSMLVSQTMIQRSLEKDWPEVTVVFDGVESVRVQAIAQEVRQDDVRVKLQAWVNDQVDYKNQVKVLVTKVVVPQGSGIRPSQTQISFPDLEGLPFGQIDWLAKNLSGVRLTQIKFANVNDPDDVQIANGQAYFVLQKMLPVASDSLLQGTILNEDHVSPQWVTIKRGNFEYIESAEKLIGKRLKQALPRGDAFTQRLIDSARLVERNQLVNLIIKNGDIEIASRATTMDAGVKGQVVDVVNVINKKRMRAKVIDEKTVEAVAF